MPSDSDLALVGASGVSYVAATATAAPVAFAALNAAFHTLGYISDDGLTETREEDRKEWTPWGNLNPIRTMITKSTKKFKMTCWESNLEVISLYYRIPLASLTVTTGVFTFEDNDQPQADYRSFVFDITDGTNLMRYYVPKGEVAERGDVTYKTDELVARELTITAYPSDAGVSVKRWFDLDAIPT